jgi:hypothetical protein
LSRRVSRRTPQASLAETGFFHDYQDRPIFRSIRGEFKIAVLSGDHPGGAIARGYSKFTIAGESYMLACAIFIYFGRQLIAMMTGPL